MPRAVNSVVSKAKKKKILKAAKGYYGARSKVFTVAKNAVEKSLLYSYIGRKIKKRNFRRLWIQRVNAGVRNHGISYSKFMGKLAKNSISINRKLLAWIAVNKPEDFNFFVKFILNK